MIEDVSGMDPAEQILELNTLVTHRPTAALDALLARRAAGEPLQYVLGAWSFCGLDLFVDRRVLIPRPETEVVAQLAIAEVERLGERVGRHEPWSGGSTRYAVADLGTGSGALALALAASLPDAEVWATDASDDALQVARANVGAAGSFAARVRIADGSWFEALPDARCAEPSSSWCRTLPTSHTARTSPRRSTSGNPTVRCSRGRRGSKPSSI